MAETRRSRWHANRGRTWRKRARARLTIGLATLIRLSGERADRPRRIDRFIDYFGGQRHAQPARG